MASKSPRWLAFLLLLYIFLLHAANLYLFTRGFLLTRLSLPNISSCPTCTLHATHSRAVLLIIDALRFDFLSPSPPFPPSPYHHHVLTLPSQLTSENPTHSLLFNTFADPPTTTLQRIKGITTGSLPTFVDVGSNFAGSEICEDSIILQMTRAGRKIAFMGDDTWTTVYPTSFSPNMTFPYDSFNVEDLHSVDEGIIRHLFPLLEKNASSSWDLLIGHFLGVDHVAHRLGPAHPTMTAKLTQMNEVLSRVVEYIDDDTLLIVIGDHGMDRKGDHGGDGEHETSAATWIYSKSIPLSSMEYSPPLQLVPNITFPGANVSHRQIQQIDLVPTLSLLLGLPIPFNNLGTIIPELFSVRGEAQLEKALRLNADQVKAYLDAYRSTPNGGELDSIWDDIHQSWASTLSGGSSTSLTLHTFTRLALASCRSLWAQFNIVLMYAGFFAMLAGNLAVYALFKCLGYGPEYWETHGWDILKKTGFMSSVGMAVAAVISGLLGLTGFVGVVESALLGATFASSCTVLVCTLPNLSFATTSALPTSLILHALAFLSNSFTFWEDRILNFLLLTSLVPFVVYTFRVPKADIRLRRRVFLFSTLFAVCVRLAGISTVCREEQYPFCHVTFYASSSLPSPPVLVLLVSIPTSIAFPSTVRRFLAISRSDKGVAPLFLEWGFRFVLLAANACWIFEWLESADILPSELATTLRNVRTFVARLSMGTTLLGGGALWWFSPLCLELSQISEQSGKKHVQVIGFANSYGSSFLLFTLIPFSLLINATQLTGQITLVLLMIAFLAFLEVIDSVRDIKLTDVVGKAAETGRHGVATTSFTEVMPVALLALHAFFSTGHQSTLPSIQWKTAFLLTPTLSYPISPFLVILNTFGPLFAFAVAVPLLALWKVAPFNISASHDVASQPESDPPRFSVNSRVLVSVLRACLGLSLYFSILLLSSAASSAWLRRHLMVWKVFAPRFMLAGATMLAVDVGVLIGVTLGVGAVIQKVHKTFGAPA